MEKPANPLKNIAPVDPEPTVAYLKAIALDTNPRKVDLGPGVYLDENGRALTFEAVKKAERAVLDNPDYDKNYVLADGMTDLVYIEAVQKFAFGEDPSTPPRDCVMTI
jgi:aspartate/tyrosine/aromatic aminotransferase